jgi:hypothetical protein
MSLKWIGSLGTAPFPSYVLKVCPPLYFAQVSYAIPVFLIHHQLLAHIQHHKIHPVYLQP